MNYLLAHMMHQRASFFRSIRQWLWHGFWLLFAAQLGAIGTANAVSGHNIGNNIGGNVGANVGANVSSNVGSNVGGLLPIPNAVLPETTLPKISATFVGAGIIPNKTILLLDGVNITRMARITASGLLYMPTSPLPEGLHQVSVQVFTQNNQTSQANWSFTTRSAPEISARLPADTFFKTIPMISAQYRDVASGIDASKTRLLLDTQDVTQQAQVRDTGISYTPTNLSQGVHVLNLSVEDKLGNRTATTWQFTFDSEKPSISEFGPQASVPSSASLSVFARYADLGAGIERSKIKLLLDGNDVSRQASVTSSEISYPAANLASGEHQVALSVADLAGNVSEHAWRFTVLPVVTAPPVISNLHPKDVRLESGARPSLSASYAGSGAAIDISQVRLELDGVDVSANSVISADGLRYDVRQNLPDGEHQVVLKVADVHGNQAQASWRFVSANAPQLTQLTPKDVVLPFASRPEIGAQIVALPGNMPPTEVRLFFDGVEVSAQTQVTNNRISFTPSEALAPGLHNVFLEVSNQFKASARQLWTFEVAAEKIYKLNILSPAPNSVAANPSVPIIVTANANNSFPVSVTLNGKPMQSVAMAQDAANTLRYSADLDLLDGVNPIVVSATYADGQSKTAASSVIYRRPVQLTITSPLDKVTLGPVSPNSPRDLTGNVERPVQITGKASKPVRSVTINQQGATLLANGTEFVFNNFFLHEGINLLNAVAIDEFGQTASTSITVTVDQTAPLLSIEAPTSDTVTSNEKIDVRGVVNDAVEAWVDAPYATVKVLNRANQSEVLAKVSDRYFFAQDVLLEIGSNPLQITAIDHVGNARSREVLVTRIATGSQRLTLLSGNRQRAALNTELAQPLVVIALAKDGNPLANLPVQFDVKRGTGSISLQPAPANAGLKRRNLEVHTDAAGRAQVWHTLGKQSGDAANLVRASHRNIAEEVNFTATAEKGVPRYIRADGGVNQYGETSASAMEALTAVVSDSEENRLPNTPVVFTVEEGDAAFFDAHGQASSSLQVLTDKNGLAVARPQFGVQAGLLRISAKAINPQDQTEIHGADYQITVLQQKDGPTSFSGKVLSHNGIALPGVRVSLGRTSLSATTDSTGFFSFDSQVPTGKLDLFIDGRTANVQTNQYPALHFEALAVKGQNNALPHPIYLPPLLMSEAKIVGGEQDVVLKMPGFEGFEMLVKANSVTFPDGSKTGLLVISPVQQDKLPMVPPGGYNGFMAPAWTIQPSGTRFDPPIQVKIPNSIGLKAGEAREIFQWDHDLATFVPMGRATVNEDASLLITDANSGVTKAGWGGPPNPPPAPPKCATSKPPELQAAKIKVTDFKEEDEVIEFVEKTLHFEADVKFKNCTPKYEWDFDGASRTGRSVSYSFGTPKKVAVKLKVSCKATCRDASDPAQQSKERDVYAAKVTFEEGWDDQYGDIAAGGISEAQGWNPARQTGNEDKPYALMGVRADDSGRIKVKFKLEPDEAAIKKKLKFGLSTGGEAKGESGGNKDATGEITGDTVYIKVMSPEIADQYPVVGLDKNKDQKLSVQELAKPGDETQWKFRMVSNAEYARSISEYNAGVVHFGAIGQAWLSSFRDGSNPPDAQQSAMQLKRRETGLSHVAGAVFAGKVANASGPSKTLTYPSNSMIVKEIVNNAGFNSWLQSAIIDQVASFETEVMEYGSAVRTFTFSNSGQGIPREKLTLVRASTGFADLYAAVGDTNKIAVTVRVRFDRPSTLINRIVATKVELIDGEISDLFDWSYDLVASGVNWSNYLPQMGSAGEPGSPAAILGQLAVMARAGAKIQASHQGIGSARPGGLVFNNVYQLGGWVLPPFTVQSF